MGGNRLWPLRVPYRSFGSNRQSSPSAQAIAASSREAAFKSTTAVSKGILEFKPAKPRSG
jgi:hypothetical protein